ncbi:MAG: hypothetical protein WA294_16820 [Acidobacteriaceae bacterium]
MRLRSVFPVASILLSGFASVSVFAQAPGVPVGENHYTIVQANDGKSVGSADCTVGSVASGYQINSRGDMKMAKFSYSFSNENRLDSQLNIVRDQLTGTVNGAAVTFSLESDSTGRLFNVNIQASGKNATNSFDRHQRTVLMPDLDPAAYIEMAHFALGNPPTAWIVIPKQNGLLVPADYEPKADAHGTLQGQAVLVHHTSVIVSSLNGITAEIYYTNDGSLMEADLPEQNFYVIHDGFRLESRPTYQPPRGSAPPPQQGEPQSQVPRMPGAPEYTVPPGQATQQPPQYTVPQGSPQPQIQPQSF